MRLSRGQDLRPRPAASAASGTRPAHVGADRRARAGRAARTSNGSGAPSRRTTPRSSSCTRPRSSTRRVARATARTGDWCRFGYGPGDNPIFDRMHEAGALVVGASVTAARAVWSGDVEHAFNAAGGLHHAMPERASGFCVYDDPAVAIAWLLRAGRRAGRLRRRRRASRRRRAVHLLRRPARADDLDPRVRAEWFFPGTGAVTERGGPAAEGSAVNVPLPPFTGDDAWLDAFRRGRPAAGAAVRAGRAGDAARMRHARDRPARADAAHDARLSRDREGAARRWRTRRPAADGWRPAAAATNGRASSRGRGRSRSPRWRTRSCPTSSPRAGSSRRSSRSAARSRRRSRSRRWVRATATTGRARSRPRCAPGRPRGVRVTTRTKLVCTLGPATNTPKFIRGLVTAGATIFRINFSHGTPADHARAVELVRAAEAKRDRALAVMADLPGPKVRLGVVRPDPLKLAPGQAFALRPDGEGRRGRRGDDVSGAGARPAGRRPDPAGRRRGRAHRVGHRRVDRADRSACAAAPFAPAKG